MKNIMKDIASSGQGDRFVSKIVIASFGGGTNSSAMLVRWVLEKKPLHLILFADTGAEKPETYCHVERFSHWLAKHGYPEIVTVRNKYRDGRVDSLEERCIENKMLPSYAYGFKSCSKRYKVAPQDKFVNNWESAKKAWKDGHKITKLIGYDAGEEHRVLNAMSKPQDKKYNYKYPLYEWRMERDDCVDMLRVNGITQPGKSSCFFCPASKKIEIRSLAKKYPELIERALNMERIALPNCTTVKGLGRDWSWEGLLKNGELFPEMFPEPRGIEICCDCYDG